MSDERTSPIKTPKQLVIVVALGLLVPLTLFLLLSQLITGVKRDDAGETEARVLCFRVIFYFDLDQALVDQRFEFIQVGCTDGFSGIKRTTPKKDAQAGK